MMKLNLYILQEELTTWAFAANICEPDSEECISYPYLCTHRLSSYRPDLAYVIPAHLLPERTLENELTHFVCIGKPSEPWLEEGANLIYTTRECTPEDMINQVLSIFQRYKDWQEAMEDIVNQRDPVRRFAEISIDFFNNPIYLQSNSFYLFFQYIPYMALPNAVYRFYLNNMTAKEGEYLNFDEVTAMLSNQEFLNLAEKTAPCIYSGSDYGFRSLYLNIRVLNVPMAKLFIDEVVTPLRHGDYLRINLLGRYLGRFFENGHLAFSYNRPQNLDEILTDLLNHKFINEHKIKYVLTGLNWEIESEYICLVSQNFSDTPNTHDIHSQALLISREIMCSCYTVVDNRIIFVVNLKHIHSSAEDLYHMLLAMERELMLCTGFSDVFTDFKYLYDYYQQALAALNLGRQAHPSAWYFWFDDYRMEFLLQRYRGKLNPRALIPQGIFRLQDHDREKGTNYMAMLKEYLDCDRNATTTAAMFYQSRNSFLYHLGKIQKILGMSLEDVG